MWERAALKYNAKQVLKSTYWVSFGVCIVAGLLGGGGNGFSFSANGNSFSGKNGGDNGFFENFAIFLPIIIVAIVIGVSIAIAVSIFFSSPVQAGKGYFFIRAPYGDVSFQYLFKAFKAGSYLPIVKAMFFMNLYIFLWSLLFVIPGIVKSYQYRMVPYIIAEDPSLTTEQAFDLSRRMTDGEKGAMFLLDLSFIGWGLLAVLTLGLGFLFLAPYIEATWAQLYLTLRQKVTTPY